MDTLEIQICLGAEASPLRHAYSGDAGLDMCASEEVSLAPFERKLVNTSLSIAIPEGYAGLVLPRSGLSHKHGITLINTPGLIDSGYRGEICISMVNLDPEHAYIIKRGDRIAQLVFVAVPPVVFSECNSLEDTQRGSRGFGSSGSS